MTTHPAIPTLVSTPTTTAHVIHRLLDWANEDRDARSEGARGCVVKLTERDVITDGEWDDALRTARNLWRLEHGDSPVSVFGNDPVMSFPVALEVARDDLAGALWGLLHGATPYCARCFLSMAGEPHEIAVRVPAAGECEKHGERAA